MTQPIIPKGFLDKIGAPEDLRNLCLAFVEKARNSGSRVRVAREHLGLPQKACGELLGVSRRGLQDIEAQKNVPSGQSLAAMLGLGINVNWVLTGEGPERIGEQLLRVSEGSPVYGSASPFSRDRWERAKRIVALASLDVVGDVSLSAYADAVAAVYFQAERRQASNADLPALVELAHGLLATASSVSG